MVESPMNTMPIDLVLIPSQPVLVVPKAFLEAYIDLAFLDLLYSLVEQHVVAGKELVGRRQGLKLDLPGCKSVSNRLAMTF